MIPLLMTEAALAPKTAAAVPGETLLASGQAAFTAVFDLLQETSVNDAAARTPAEDDAPDILPMASTDEGEDGEEMIAFVATDATTIEKQTVNGRDWRVQGPPDKAKEAVVVPPETVLEKTKAVTAAPDAPAQQTSRQTTFAQMVVEGRFPTAASPAQVVAAKAVVVPAPLPHTDIAMAMAMAVEVADAPRLRQDNAIGRVKTVNPPVAAELSFQTLTSGKKSPSDTPLPEPRLALATSTPATTVMVPQTAVAVAPVLSAKPETDGKMHGPVDPVSDIEPALAGSERATHTPPIATVTATPVTAAAETARHVAGQLAVAITGNAGQSTEIALNPEELGRVRLSITAIDASITLHVQADRPETNDLLRRHIETLAQEFRALGYQNISFSFSGGSQANDQSDQEPQLDGGTPEADPTETQQLTSQRQPSSGLDLRL